MRVIVVLLIMISGLSAQRLGEIAGVKLELPLNIEISTFLERSIGYEPKALIKDGLPFFGSKRGDFLRKPRAHKGLDIYTNHSDVLASASGCVKEVVKGKRSGLYIKLLHAHGVETLYIHLSLASVKVGDMVHQGMVIGRIDGASGNAIQAQLHYEIKLNGIHQDPIPIIQHAYHDDVHIQETIKYDSVKMRTLVGKRNHLVEIYLKAH